MADQVDSARLRVGDKVTMTVTQHRRWWQFRKPRSWAEDVELTVEHIAHFPAWVDELTIRDVQA